MIGETAIDRMNLVSIVPKSERALEAHGAFVKDIEERVSDLKKVALTVLVWGPGETCDTADGKVKLIRNKRIEMLNALRLDGHDAVFSEELDEEIASLKEIGNYKIEELIEAHCVDMVCLLWETSGSIGEAHDFCNRKEVAHKILLFMEKTDKEFYARGMLEIFKFYGGKLEQFDDVDLKDCHVVGKAVEWASTFRKIKYLIQNGGGTH